MAFGVTRDKTVESGETERRIIKAVTTETVVALVGVGVLFALFAWKMGLAFMFKTMMATAHDLILSTVLFLMAVIMSLTSEKGFLKYFKKWQVTTLINLGTVFGMGLIVTTFMLAQSSADQPLGRAVLLGNIGAILGGIVSVRLMGHFGDRKYGQKEDVLTEEQEGYNIFQYREVRQGNVAQRALQSLLDGGAHGVQTGLDIMPGIVIICTLVMMLAFGAKEICVFTAIGICTAGFLSTHVGMMDGIKERDLTSVAILTHLAGSLSAGVFGHVLFLLFG